MNAACLICRGACCESVVVPRTGEAENDKWLLLHGEPSDLGGVVLACRCKALQDDGSCGVYQGRPQPCQDFKVGCMRCRESVEMKRSAEVAALVFAEMPQ
jgi:hypothetical protein